MNFWRENAAAIVVAVVRLPRHLSFPRAKKPSTKGKAEGFSRLKRPPLAHFAKNLDVSVAMCLQ